jgi:dynein heavy chain
MVSQSMSLDEPGAGGGGGGEPVTNVPAARSNHTAVLVENTIILCGGHGGMGYQRRPFNDAWMLNLDNDRWAELACQGNPPAPRSGHASFAKDGCVYVFGGWNSESQFNDLFMLDVENKDWSDLDLAWSVPRWNMALQLVEAIPSWRVFVFGGSSDRLGEGRSMGAFDRRIGVLDLGEQYRWDDPVIEEPGKGQKKEVPAMREHCAICYEPDESRLIIFGGWAYKWLDDVWQINVSSIVGPPYAIIKVEPPLGPVTGNQNVSIHGVGFNSTQGTVVVRFSSAKHFAEAQAHVVNDELIECHTPPVISSIGPKECEVRLAIGIRDFTTTVTNYLYFLDTVAEKSLTYGPGVLEEQQANVETRLMIQARNKDSENRKSGRDEWVITCQQKKQSAEGKDIMKDIPFELIDMDNGRYEMVYQADEGDVVIHIKCIDENSKPRPIRGSPFKPSFTNMAKNRANEYTGPLISSFLANTLKSLEEFFKTTESGITTKLKKVTSRASLRS